MYAGAGRNQNLHDMKYQTLLTLPIFLLIANIAAAQVLEGNWKGTSLCQIKSSPCHDEVVVYHISKDGNNSYRINADKIIKGKEIDMGTLVFSFDPQLNILYLVDSIQQIRWQFKVVGKEMHGTLSSNGRIYRIVELKKEE
jgi:hypothetical protein